MYKDSNIIVSLLLVLIKNQGWYWERCFSTIDSDWILCGRCILFWEIVDGSVKLKGQYCTFIRGKAVVLNFTDLTYYILKKREAKNGSWFRNASCIFSFSIFKKLLIWPDIVQKQDFKTYYGLTKQPPLVLCVLKIIC